MLQEDNDSKSDKDKQLAIQQVTINKVIDWLRQEGLEPQDITHLRKDAYYYGVVITDETEKTDPEARQRREAFHILFPVDRFDSLRISEIIIFDLQTQKSYSSLATTPNGILDQNRFYFDLELALLQMNVYFTIKKNIRELQSLEVSKVVFFDGLTKDTLFDTVNVVHNSVKIARIKTSQLRDRFSSS